MRPLGESTSGGLRYAGPGDGGDATIRLQTEIPGPSRGGSRSARRRGRGAAVCTSDLRSCGRERDDHGRRRERLRRLRGRRRRRQRRSRASARRRRGGRAGRALPPHGLHGRPLRDVSPSPSGCARSSRSRADPRGVLQRRDGGGRERGQARAPAHRPSRGDRVRGRLPRADAALDDDDLEVPPVQGRDGAVRARGVPHVVSERLPGPDAITALAQLERVLETHVAPSTSRRSSSSHSRARAGSSRAAGLCRGAAGALRPPRDRPRRRRGADGFGRTGRMFAMEHFGVEPDLVTVAKSIAAASCPRA